MAEGECNGFEHLCRLGMQPVKSLTLKEAKQGLWDVVVIGAGMGGGILGRRLAERGQRVLFIEKGPAGHAAEQVVGPQDMVHPEARLLRGLWPKQAEFRKDGKATRFHGPYGAGVGGSSAFYAAALERPERHDLDEDANLPHPTGGWPVGYEAFTPYFDEASRLLYLTGTANPLAETPEIHLREPSPMPPGDQALMEEMQANGLHPYRQHLAIRYPDRCRQCFGSKCPWGCKMDGRSAGVVPALETGQAALLDMCDVTRILSTDGRVTGLNLTRDGETTELSASTYVLCAGSLGSALLLLKSDVANSSGLVGRGLMFHLNEFFVLWPRRKAAPGEGAAFGKSISLRDLYSGAGARFGLVQSLGLDATYGNMVGYLNQLYDQSPLRHIKRFRGLTRIPALFLSRLFGKASVFVGILEDFPYPENRVVLNEEDPDILTFEYSYHPELLARRKGFRRALKKAFKGQKRFMVSLQPMLNFGHPVGTLRFGRDPATSVLNPDCRSHDLENLYVADGAFMPSALGVNPSLTIAANALRVADIIADRAEIAERTSNVAVH